MRGMLEHFGRANKWALIAKDETLSNRSNVDVKDRARNLGLQCDVSTRGKLDAMLQAKQAEREARQAKQAERQAERDAEEVQLWLEEHLVALEHEMLEARLVIARRMVRGVHPALELYQLVHSRMYKAGVRGVKVEEALGCSLQDFADYVESKFEPGMTWENRGRREGLLGWELDHIRPLVSFDLPDEWAAAFHYTNVQPLWNADNMRKGRRG